MAQPTRGETSRTAEYHDPIGGDYAGELAIDVSGLPSNMEAIWMRESTLEQRDGKNITLKQRQGYVPVTTDMIPSAAVPGWEGEDPNTNKSSKLIRNGGLLLVMRPKRDAEAERATLRQENRAALMDAARLSKGGGNAQFDGDVIENAPEVKLQNEGVRKGPLSDQ